jgi:hypothetical protein
MCLLGHNSRGCPTHGKLPDPRSPRGAKGPALGADFCVVLFLVFTGCHFASQPAACEEARAWETSSAVRETLKVRRCRRATAMTAVVAMERPPFGQGRWCGVVRAGGVRAEGTRSLFPAQRRGPRSGVCNSAGVQKNSIPWKAGQGRP